MRIKTGMTVGRIAGLLVSAVLCGQSSGVAQTLVAVDVKTALAEKKALAVAKSGVISYLKQSTWAKVAELHEQYAIWLANYRQIERGTTRAIELDVEVRAPRAIGKGAVTATRHVVVNYDLAATYNELAAEQRKAAVDLESGRAMQALMLTLGSTFAGALFEDKSDRTVVKRAVFYASQDLQKTPTFEETVECLAVGATVMRALEDMRARREF
jgi:hypothetical protein